MNKVKGIAFDLEGPLIDTYDIHGMAHILAAHDAWVEVTMEYLITRCRLLCGWMSKTVIEDIITNFAPDWQVPHFSYTISELSTG